VVTGTFETGDDRISLPPATDGTSGDGTGDLRLVVGYWLLVAFALFGLWMAVRSGHGTPASVVVVGALLLVAGLLVYALLAIGGYTPLPPELVTIVDGLFDLPDTSTAGEKATGATTSPDTPGAGDGSPLAITVVLGGVIGVGLAVVTWSLYAGRRPPAQAAQPAPGGEDTPDTDAVARAAGRAADRLGEPAAANPVFRAWQEMTTALPVADPETTTPAEFADIAVAAGFDPADVSTVTDVFREVRYGDAPVSEARIARARGALRRIEASGRSGDDPTDPGGREP
jgi:hypothetical protein